MYYRNGSFVDVTAGGIEFAQVSRTCLISGWLVMLAVLIPPTWLATWRIRRSRRLFPGHPACPTCGYDTRASPTRCPECGAAIREATT